MKINKIGKQLQIDNVLDFLNIYEIYETKGKLNDEQSDYYVILFKFLEQEKFKTINKYRIEEYLSKFDNIPLSVDISYSNLIQSIN
jgi:hypothetical protein